MAVYNEWGKLREVLVGNTLRDTLPHWSPDWGRYFPQMKEELMNHGGKLFSDCYPEQQKLAREQTEGLAKTLTDYGIRVHRPRLLTDEERALEPVGNWAQYPRDTQVVIGNHIIETNLRMTHRFKEQFGYEEFFREWLLEHPEMKHVHMPSTTPEVPGKTDEDFLNDPRPLLEGGDTFLMGKDILVGFSSLASSPNGAKWLQHYLEPEGYRVHIVPLTDIWLHLDCMFAVLKEGLGLVCSSGLKGGIDALPKFMKDWEFIEATEEEAHKLGTNSLCLEPGVVLMDSTLTRIVKEVEKRGVKVVGIPFDGPAWVGGGIRCSTHPLIRDE